MFVQRFETETEPAETVSSGGSPLTQAAENLEAENSLVRSEDEALAQTVQELVSEAPVRKRLRQRMVALCLTATGITATSGLLVKVTVVRNDTALGREAVAMAWRRLETERGQSQVLVPMRRPRSPASARRVRATPQA